MGRQATSCAEGHAAEAVVQPELWDIAAGAGISRSCLTTQPTLPTGCLCLADPLQKLCSPYNSSVYTAFHHPDAGFTMSCIQGQAYRKQKHLWPMHTEPRLPPALRAQPPGPASAGTPPPGCRVLFSASPLHPQQELGLHVTPPGAVSITGLHISGIFQEQN